MVELMKLALLCGAAKMIMRQEDFKNIGVIKSGPLDLLLKEIARLCTEAIFPTTVHTTLGWSLTKFGYDQCVRVKMPCLLYIYRVHIGVTSRKLRISYLPETLYILSFWEVRLIQFLAKYHIFRLRISCWRMGYLSFHAKCDNMSATITVIQRTDGFISGGFSGWLQKLQSFRDLGVPDNLTTRVLVR